MTTYATLRRTDITSLDEALYAASCFAGSTEPDRTVTIMCAIRGNKEHYYIAPGRTPTWTDEKAGLRWVPCYVLERSSER